METVDEKSIPGFLRQEEMNRLVASEKDPITANLMSLASHILILRVARREKGPQANFDLGYFMEVIQEFANDHETLRKILEGKGDEFIWLSETDSLESPNSR